MNRFAVSVVGTDRPGIVAAVTGVFVEQGCNLQDTAMTILGGCFTMMLVVEAETGTTAAGLEMALAATAGALDLLLMVRPIADTSPGGHPKPSAGHDPQGTRCTLSVYGGDRPGIVHGVAELLATQSVNIVDLTTRVVGEIDHPVYAMVLEIDVPPAVDPLALARDLDDLAGGLGVSANLHPSEADIL